MQQIKRNIIGSIFSNLCKCRSSSKLDVEKKTSKNLTMETRITDDKNITTGTTVIECINYSRLSSIQEHKQSPDQTGK